MKYIVECLFFLLLFVWCSCQYPSQKKFPDEHVLEALIVERPDSVAELLEKYMFPLELPAKEKADYAWWLANAHFRQGRSLVNDSLIHFAVEYYEEVKSPRLTSSYRLAGKQINSTGMYPEEEETFLNKALELAIQSQDTVEIIECYNAYISLYKQTNETRKSIDIGEKLKRITSGTNQALVFFNLVCDYAVLSIQDSVLTNIQKGLELAYALDEKDLTFSLSRQYANYLSYEGKKDEAVQVLRDLDAQYDYPPILALDYAFLWLNFREVDSAEVYVKQLADTLANFSPIMLISYPDLDPFSISTEALKLMVDIERGNAISSSSHGDVGNRVMRRNYIRRDIEKELQFSQNKLTKDKLTLQLEREKLIQRLSWAGFAALFVLFVLVCFYQRKLLAKEQILRKTNEQIRSYLLQLSENEQAIRKNEELIKNLSSLLGNDEELKEMLEEYKLEIESLTNENEHLHQRNKILQKDIQQFSGTLKQKNQELLSYEILTQESRILKDRERHLIGLLFKNNQLLSKAKSEPTYINEAQWLEIIQLSDLLYTNFTHKLHDDFPSLTEEDIRFCTLMRLGMSTSIIAIQMAISPSSVTKRKQRIKEKMYQQKPMEINKRKSLETYLFRY